MKKVLAFGASLSETSINQQLAEFAASILKGALVDTIKLTDFYPMAMYGTQKEMPENAFKMFETMGKYDGFIISLSEHNGTYTAGFKNALDWLSTVGNQDGVFHKKPVFIMGTAPGPKGAQFVIEAGKNRFTWNGASEITGTFSLPAFGENFNEVKGIVHEDKLTELNEKLEVFVSKL